MILNAQKIVKKYAARKSQLKLLPRYFDFFEYRYGISDGKIHTLEETGRKFGVSGSRARQIIGRVMYEVEKIAV
jgi:DNA-directed RNA polymerase sigma subunit (sigma70/sigma32)